MAAKQKQVDEGNVPESAKTNGETNGTAAIREGVVGEPVKTSFDERTQNLQPFIQDGKQVTGEESIEEVKEEKPKNPEK